MSLFQNLNKKSMTIAATVLSVLVGGVGVSFALSVLPDESKESPTTTIIAGVPTQDLALAADSTVAVVAPGSTATSSTSTSTSSVNASAMTTPVGAPPAASIGGIGGDDDDGEDDHEEDDDDD
jgi:hypothetical protein